MTAKDKLLQAYQTMLERVKGSLQHLEEGSSNRLHQAVEAAKEKASELGELSKEEAEKVGDYLRRDVEDAAQYLAGADAQELKDWLRFDIERVEEDLWDAFMSVADQTKVELMRLEQQAQLATTYHTGELTGIGALVCTQCGKELHFFGPGHIPPCAGCKNTTFVRKED